eukprot:982059-Prymnesium_polylepis.1
MNLFAVYGQFGSHAETTSTCKSRNAATRAPISGVASARRGDARSRSCLARVSQIIGTLLE